MIQIDIDMPKCCAKCPCGNAQDAYCYAKDEYIEKLENGYPDIKKRPDWCPIREVKHGRWIDMGDFEQCSVCKATHLKTIQTVYGNVTWIKSDYCPACGARMDENAEID